MGVDTKVYVIADESDMFRVINRAEMALKDIVFEKVSEKGLNNHLQLRNTSFCFDTRVSVTYMLSDSGFPVLTRNSFTIEGKPYILGLYNDYTGGDIHRSLKIKETGFILSFAHDPSRNTPEIIERMGRKIKEEMGLRVFFMENDSDEEFVEL